jgi:hypothetical protein
MSSSPPQLQRTSDFRVSLRLTEVDICDFGFTEESGRVSTVSFKYCWWCQKLFCFCRILRFCETIFASKRTNGNISRWVFSSQSQWCYYRVWMWNSFDCRYWKRHADNTSNVQWSFRTNSVCSVETVRTLERFAKALVEVLWVLWNLSHLKRFSPKVQKLKLTKRLTRSSKNW